KIKVSDGPGRRKVRCPHCKAVAEVPAADDSFEESPKSRPRAAAKSFDDHDEERPRREKRSRRFDEDDDDRPPQRRQRPDEQPTKSKKVLVIGVWVGLGVVCIGGGVLTFFLTGRGPAVDSQPQMDMKMIGLAYHTQLDVTRKPPARAEDLQAFLLESPTAL